MTNVGLVLRLLAWLVIGTFCAVALVLGLFALAMLVIISGAF